jgi:hypothetical protein
VYDNNPGFGVLIVNNGQVESFGLTYLLLEDYHRFGGLISW